jgi:NADH:ubiquinone oxidoreductase subunit F (NADH-binding)
MAVNGGPELAHAQSTGTKIHSVSGDCERPGIYEYPFGTRVGRMLEDCGAKDTQAVQVGGPSGVCLSAFEFSRRIGFEDVPTAGAFMVFDRSRDMFDSCATLRIFLPTKAAVFAPLPGRYKAGGAAHGKTAARRRLALMMFRCCLSWTS